MPQCSRANSVLRDVFERGERSPSSRGSATSSIGLPGAGDSHGCRDLHAKRRSPEIKLSPCGIRWHFHGNGLGDQGSASGNQHPMPFLRAAESLGLAPASALAVGSSANMAALFRPSAAGIPTAHIPGIAPVPPDVRALCWQILPD